MLSVLFTAKLLLLLMLVEASAAVGGPPLSRGLYTRQSLEGGLAWG